MAVNNLNSSLRYSKPTFQVCIIGESLKDQEDFIRSVQHFNLPILYSSSGLELVHQGGEFKTIFILEEFEGDVFTSLQKSGQKILGPTCVTQLARLNEPLPNNIRPLYSTSMANTVITFSGFRVKEEVSRLAALIHYMGGSVRKDFSPTKTTHLVATELAIRHEKYQHAVVYDIPIMTSEWVFQAWQRRSDPDFLVTTEEMSKYKLLPFVGCKLAFLGYKSDEEQHMTEITKENGGDVTDTKHPSCTHIIVDDEYSGDSPYYEDMPFIVKNEWFWACIQMEAKADECIYIYANSKSPLLTSSVMPIRGNKRQRLESVAHQLALENQENDFFNISIDSKKKLSLSTSFLDATVTPEKILNQMSPVVENHWEEIKSPPPPKIDMRSLSARQQVCCELLQTESNYEKILDTILSVFKEPLENPDKTHGLLLAPAEVRIIFGNLPPIHNIHRAIKAELTHIIQNWREDHCIGNVILNHAHELMKYYPPFINFFEETKEVLQKCDASKPRFHAFLKRCQSNPNCGRQTLQELLIRPVQRLPSVILLLNDILKHTPKENPDNQALENAIQALKNVLMHINEDKRKTEGQLEMFEIINDIEECPPLLLSSHRSLILKTDLHEVTDMLCKKNKVVTMFLFSDVLEFCKKKAKAVSSLKSPSVTSLASVSSLKTPGKSYKHIVEIYLQHIRRIVDVAETEECKNAFAIVYWSNKELKELIYAFILLDDVCKSEFLQVLCRQTAKIQCKADTENLLTMIEPHLLDLPSSENAGNALTKALNKTRCKLGRAFSMRKTPTKRSLSRAVSSIISPLRRCDTPSTPIGMRLSSVTNLTELTPSSSMFSIPSPITGKRMKSSSYGPNITKQL